MHILYILYKYLLIPYLKLARLHLGTTYMIYCTDRPQQDDRRSVRIQSQGGGVNLAGVPRRHRSERSGCVPGECDTCKAAGPLACH